MEARSLKDIVYSLPNELDFAKWHIIEHKGNYIVDARSNKNKICFSMIILGKRHNLEYWITSGEEVLESYRIQGKDDFDFNQFLGGIVYGILPAYFCGITGYNRITPLESKISIDRIRKLYRQKKG